MKFGQAMSVFEAALPEEVAGALPRGPDQAAGGRAAAARGDRARRPRRAAGGGLADAVRPVRRQAGRGRQHRPGAQGGLGRRPRGGGQDPVPRRRQGAALRPAPARPAGPVLRGLLPRPGHQAAAQGARRTGSPRSSTTASRPRASRPSPPRTTATPTSASPRSSRARTGCSSPSGSTACPLSADDPRRHARSSATGRRRCSPSSCSPARSWRGCCTPTRTPGNFRLLPDGRLGVIDFGAVNRLPDGAPEPIGRLARLALDGDAEQVLDALRAEGFVKPGIDVDAEAVLDYLLPLLEPIASRQLPVHPEWLRREALRLADPRSPGRPARPPAQPARRRTCSSTG